MILTRLKNEERLELKKELIEFINNKDFFWKMVNHINWKDLTKLGRVNYHNYMATAKDRFSNYIDRFVRLEKLNKIDNNNSNVFYSHKTYNDIAKEYKIGVQFQPADQIFSYRDNKNINFLFSPKEEDYRKVISFLLEEKSKGNKFIYNSISGLKHIYHWPKPQKINCLLSLLRCHIEPDGRIFVCNDFRNYQKYLVSVDVSYKESFDKLSLPYPCKECWCSDIEYNMCESFKLDSLLDMWKRFSSK